ncbi:MAG: hypothetical protein Q7R96_01755 [Nanoarchaeota archaeon]|nr:hypothetical protein [Nanoarchaeota archaeon]
MLSKPYVGVTGITSEDEARQVQEFFFHAGYDDKSTHMPMIGILASYKTLHEQSENKRYPTIHNVPKILRQIDNKIFRVVHYHTREHATLYDQVEMFGEFHDHSLLDGLQLNVVWPFPKEVERIKSSFPGLRLVLWINETMMGTGVPAEVLVRLREYRGFVDYFLLDPSGGHSKEFRIADVAEWYLDIDSSLPWSIGGIAGGFSAGNVEEKVRDFSLSLGRNSFSIDAEGLLRDKVGKGFGNDKLNLKKTHDYIRAAALLLK